MLKIRRQVLADAGLTVPDPEKRLRFQNFIFEDNLEFSGEKFGIRKLSPIYSIYQQYLADPSNLVIPRGEKRTLGASQDLLRFSVEENPMSGQPL